MSRNILEWYSIAGNFIEHCSIFEFLISDTYSDVVSVIAKYQIGTFMFRPTLYNMCVCKIPFTNYRQTIWFIANIQH